MYAEACTWQGGARKCAIPAASKCPRGASASSGPTHSSPYCLHTGTPSEFAFRGRSPSSRPVGWGQRSLSSWGRIILVPMVPQPRVSIQHPPPPPPRHRPGAALGSEAWGGGVGVQTVRQSAETAVKVKSIYFKKGQGEWTRTFHMKTDKQKIGPDSSSHSCRRGRFKAPTGRRPAGAVHFGLCCGRGGRRRVGFQNPLWC